MTQVVDTTPLPRWIIVLAVLLTADLWRLVRNVTPSQPVAFAGLCLVSAAFVGLSVARSQVKCPAWLVLALNAVILAGAVMAWAALLRGALGGWPYVAVAAIASFRTAAALTVVVASCAPMAWAVFGNATDMEVIVMGTTWWYNGQLLFFTLVVAIGLVTVKLMQRNYQALQASQTLLTEVVLQNERNRIMRDLHDEVGHSLVATSTHMDLLEMLLQRKQYDQLEQIVHQVGTQTRDVLLHMRSVIYGMQTLSLASQIEHSVQLMTSAGIHVDQRVDDPTGVSPDQEQVYAAILQEVVTNILRHAKASHVRITLAGGALQVEDNGVGLHPDDEIGLGITAMRERADEAGLDLRISVSPKLAGTMVHINQRDTKGPSQ